MNRLGDTDVAVLLNDPKVQDLAVKGAEKALTALGLAVSTPVIVVTAGVVAVVSAINTVLKALGIDVGDLVAKFKHEVSRKFGEREMRFDPSQLGVMIDNEYMKYVGRHVSREELDRYFNILLYGRFDFNELRRDIKNSREYKTIVAGTLVASTYKTVTGTYPDADTTAVWTANFIQNSWSAEELKNQIAWASIVGLFRSLLGRDPSENYETKGQSYWFNLLISGQQPLSAIMAGIKASPEYRAKHPSEIGKALPYIVGAGAILSAII